MRAVVLAAGEGSRMGDHTDEKPKAFMDLCGRSLYERQQAALADHVDDVTVVLGYAAENVLEDVGSADVVIVDDWDEYDNAESLRRALSAVDDDVLVVNGDVVIAESAVERLLSRYETLPAGRNAVACIPGHQEGSTAIRRDDRNLVTDYGMIRGHRHAGFGVIDGANVEPAERFLRRHREEWYPVVYPHLETEAVTIAPHNHVEINRPRDKLEAYRTVSRLSTNEIDA